MITYDAGLNTFMETSSEKWVAIVYDGVDKVGSREFKTSKSQAEKEAQEWAQAVHKSDDWSLFKVN